LEIDSYRDAGLLAAAGLVNGLTPGERHGRPYAPPDALRGALALIRAALAIDPPSVDAVKPRHVAGFTDLAERLRTVFADIDRGDLAAAATALNDLLAAHPATPHLAFEAGRWRLHHHPADAPVLPMWTTITAEALARLIGEGEHDRLGVCTAGGCDRVFVDTSRNGSRRFCSTTCQNRVKTAAFRRRRASGPGVRSR
jgi:predicted RNA-binding Zn ribbon-like protein